ncbi:hypothetical protein [Photobacterium kishitanii]|uniref:TIGR04255 family protein n=1 Tax=Photobacterium kishitanii TaxID=318456 RepID=A0A2T3KMG3_9GAMM|nr:hypothetical protein [Photobacterium kishitanii]PSV00989.1 hypothetical protein C9J27_02895 [Photobacterium kishitanii]
MKLIRTTHKLHFYIDDYTLKVTPEQLSTLRERLKDFSMTPVPLFHFNPSDNTYESVCALASEDESLQISFPGNEFMVAYICEDTSEFLALTSRVIGYVCEIFSMEKGCQIEISQSLIFRSSEVHIANFYKVNAFTWGNNVTERKVLDNSKEDIVAITTIRKLPLNTPSYYSFVDANEQQGEVSHKDKLIILNVQSKTSSKKTSKRFIVNDCYGIYRELCDSNAELIGKFHSMCSCR